MNNKTRLSQKKAQLTINDSTATLQNEAEQKITIEDVFNKLGGLDPRLDRIETKIDNLHSRVELIEGRVGKLEELEDEINEQFRPEIQKKISNLTVTQQDLQKRMEALENKERQFNVKVLNLPYHPQETKIQLQSKITELLKQASPLFSSENMIEAFRLGARQKLGQGQTEGQSSQPQNEKNQQGAAAPRATPVLVKLTSAALVQDLLKQGNKNLKQQKVRIVDDVAKSTQEKRAKLLPKMRELRSAGLFAYIPFGSTAKLVYKQNETWKTIFPDN